MDTRNKRPFGSDKPPSVNLDGASFSQVAASPSELRELAKSRLRLRELLLVDQRTPEERKLENEEMLRKLQRMRPDLYDSSAVVAAGNSGQARQGLVRDASRK